MWYGWASDALPTTDAMISPSSYVLRPPGDSGGHWDALLSVGGDLDQHVAREVFGSGPGRSANDLWNGLEPAWPPGLVDKAYVVLPLPQGRCTDDNVRLRDVTARVESSDEVFCRFDTRVGMAFPKSFGLDETVCESGKNGDIFGLAG